jgi:hypothetical protein
MADADRGVHHHLRDASSFDDILSEKTVSETLRDTIETCMIAEPAKTCRLLESIELNRWADRLNQYSPCYRGWLIQSPPTGYLPREETILLAVSQKLAKASRSDSFAISSVKLPKAAELWAARPNLYRVRDGVCKLTSLGMRVKPGPGPMALYLPRVVVLQRKSTERTMGAQLMTNWVPSVSVYRDTNGTTVIEEKSSSGTTLSASIYPTRCITGYSDAPLALKINVSLDGTGRTVWLRTDVLVCYDCVTSITEYVAEAREPRARSDESTPEPAKPKAAGRLQVIPDTLSEDWPDVCSHDSESATGVPETDSVSSEVPTNTEQWLSVLAEEENAAKLAWEEAAKRVEEFILKRYKKSPPKGGGAAQCGDNL